MATLARWCYNHRILVVVGWVLALVALTGVERSVGTAYSDSFKLPGTESTKAFALLGEAFPSQSGEADTIVLHARSGKVTDPETKAAATAMLAKVARVPHVAAVTSPFTPAGAAQVSRDETIAYATVAWDTGSEPVPPAAVKALVSAATSIESPALQVELGGNAIAQSEQRPPASSEGIGILAAAVILLIAFGSVLAMLVPLATAVLALGTATAAMGLLSHILGIATFAPTLATLIGLGVGIDYALFVVTRHRNGIKAGRTPEEAAITALDTSGRAVLFAGGTVCVALLGLLILRVSFLNGVGISAAVVVLFTMATAITLLPALLGFLGMRVLSRKERRRLAEQGPHEPHAEGVWAAGAAWVERHPRPLAAVAVVVMLVLALPVLSLRLGSSDQGNDPASSTTRKAYDLMAEAFGPGFNGQMQLVAPITSAAQVPKLDALAAKVKAYPGVAAVSPVVVAPNGKVAIINVVPTTSPQSAQTSTLIRELRSDVIPQAMGDSGVKVYVGGLTAIFDDFAEVLTNKLPLFIGVIILLGCLLLMLAFRSIVVPLTAAAMNLLAAGAAFGVVVAFFQWGWGAEPLGLGGAGPVEAFLPVMMLAILFGLSMDYQVFLVSRMHEEWVHTGDNARSVRVGQADTGRVITAAATIMIFVFGSFIFGGQRIIAEFGIGLASAVLLDAFILRTLLVPALMHIVGRANWWIPGWLDRVMPQLSVEPAQEPSAPAVRQPVAP